MVHESGNASGGPHTVDVPDPITPGVDVFISYGSDDLALAREMRGHLEVGGYRCWMAPDDVSGPKTWAEQIVDAISSCKVALVLISSVANASDHVSKEVDLALEHGKAVLPVRLEDVVPSGALRYLLALAQWIDVFPGPLGPHAEEVRQRVAAIVGGDSGTEVTPRGAVMPRSSEQSMESTRPSERRGAPPPWRKWLIGALAAAILAGVGVGIGLVVAGGDDDIPYTYGDDEALDRWWDRCENGDLSGCDRLFADAPFDTEYSYFGETCGERTDGGGECAIGDESGDSYTYGDNAELDQLWDGCNAEEFDACDALYEQSPAGSEYEEFGATCGYRTEFLAGCFPVAERARGDLDILWSGCEEGVMDACWELHLSAPEGSDEEEFGATCGGRTDGDRPCVLTLGDSPWLDELWNACAEGDMEACDLLSQEAPSESEYEVFGWTCGFRFDDGGDCTRR